MAYRFGVASLRDFAPVSPLEGAFDSVSDYSDLGPRSARPRWLEDGADNWTGSSHQAALAQPALSIVPDGGELTMSLRCGCPSCVKAAGGDAFVADGVGVTKPAAAQPPRC